MGYHQLQWDIGTVTKTILFFALTKNGGTSKPGDPCQMKYTNSYGNICTRDVDHPQVISNFFAGSNVINTHNQLRKDSLKLEKKWATQYPWFQLVTAYVGVCVILQLSPCDKCD